MKMITIALCGITQTVPEAELSIYIRAGYVVVEESPKAQPAEEARPKEPKPDKAKSKKDE